jgi:hypothetical protein
MIARLFTFSSIERRDFLIKVILSWALLFIFECIPTELIPGQPLPYFWGGIVLVGLWSSISIGITALLLHQITLTILLIFRNYSLSGIDLVMSLGIGVKIAEWIAMILMGAFAQWKEIHQPWWTFLISILGLSILLGMGGFWMNTTGSDMGLTFIKNNFTSIFILSTFNLMITQILRRVIGGRDQFYSKTT